MRASLIAAALALPLLLLPACASRDDEPHMLGPAIATAGSCYRVHVQCTPAAPIPRLDSLVVEVQYVSHRNGQPTAAQPWPPPAFKATGPERSAEPLYLFSYAARFTSTGDRNPGLADASGGALLTAIARPDGHVIYESDVGGHPFVLDIALSHTAPLGARVNGDFRSGLFFLDDPPPNEPIDLVCSPAPDSPEWRHAELAACP